MKLFIDLDGTLADFNGQPNALDRYQTEKGFFANLEPTSLVKELSYIQDTKNIYILSTSPNKQADQDKLEWVKKHVPSLNLSQVILVRDNIEKRKFALNNTLIDDHTPNLLDWLEHGGQVIKVINDHNGKIGRSKGFNKIVLEY